jgi:hypothetical protein
MMETGQASSLTELAKKVGMERTFLYHSLELVNLAPDIIGAILKGTHPQMLMLSMLPGEYPTTGTTSGNSTASRRGQGRREKAAGKEHIEGMPDGIKSARHPLFRAMIHLSI